MLSSEQIEEMQRRFQIVTAIAKHAIYSDERVSRSVGEEQFPLIKAAVDNADYDVAMLMAEVRIFSDMFNAKLESWKHGSDVVLEGVAGQEPSAGGDAVPQDREADHRGDRGERADGKQEKRPNPKRNKNRSPRRQKPVDSGDD